MALQYRVIVGQPIRCDVCKKRIFTYYVADNRLLCGGCCDRLYPPKHPLRKESSR